MKTMCPPGYHDNGFVATHALGHMMYGSTLLVPLVYWICNIEHFACSKSATYSKVPLFKKLVLHCSFYLITALCCPIERIQYADVRTSFINLQVLFREKDGQEESLLRKVKVISRCFLLVFKIFQKIFPSFLCLYEYLKVKAKSAGCATKASVALMDILFFFGSNSKTQRGWKKNLPAFDQKKTATLKCKQCDFLIIFFNLWVPRLIPRSYFSISRLKLISRLK